MGLGCPIWVFQFNEYSLLWITFLGTAWLLAENKHVQIRLLTSTLGDTANKTLTIIHNIVGFVLCGVLAGYGFYSTYDHLVRNVIDTQAVDVPKWIIIAVIPFGFTLLSLQFFRRLYISLTGADSDVESTTQESEQRL